MNFLTARELIGSEEIETLESLLNASEINFSKLVQIGKLEKEYDFRGADLSGVDFSNSDLRGFNFTETDLSGTFGINVIFDSTTIFHGARLDNSCFSIKASIYNSKLENPSLYKLTEKLNKMFWTDSVSWIHDNVKVQNQNYKEYLKVAMYHYLESDETARKSQILFFLTPAFKESGQHLEYVLSIMSAPNVSENDYESCLLNIGTQHYNTRTGYNVLLQNLFHENIRFRTISLNRITISKFFDWKSTTIQNLLKNTEDVNFRKLISKVFFETMDTSYYFLSKDPADKTYIDYKEFISEEKIIWISKDIVRNRQFKKLYAGKTNIHQLKKHQNQSIFDISLPEEEVKEMKDKIPSLLRKIKSDGLPITYAATGEIIK